jgi:Oxidoreductase family, C-terminal alpha/beta domain
MGLGRMTHAYAQWHRGIQASTPLAVREEKRKLELAQKYGYASVHEFRNWRHYKKFGGGIISDLGAHQIDIFNWFYQATPKRLVTMGGVDYWTPDNPRGHYELPDNVMVMYEYEVPAHLSPDGKVHTARAYYQTLTTTGTQGFHERFYGDCASVAMSEVPKWNDIVMESFAEAPVSADDVAKGKDAAEKDHRKLVHEFQGRWKSMKDSGLIYPIPSDRVWKGRRPWESPKPFGRQPPAWFKTPKEEDDANRLGYVDARVSKEAAAFGLGAVLTVPPHQPHLLNFFAAVEANDKSKLNCPGEEAFRTCVSVLKIYEALEKGGTYEFKPEDFTI